MDKRATVMVAVVMVMVVSGNLFAEEDLSISARTDLFSKYVFRGQQLNEDPVLQPSVTAGYRGFSATLWGNLELTPINEERGEFTEFDLLGSYSGQFPGELEKLGYSLGFVHYKMSGNGLIGTTEISAGLNLDVFLRPAVTLNWDVDENPGGQYTQFCISHAWEEVLKVKGTSIGATACVSLGWGNKHYNSYYWGVDDAGLNDLTASLCFPAKLPEGFCGGGWSVIPTVSYTTLVNDDIRAPNTYGDNDILFGGVSLQKEF